MLDLSQLTPPTLTAALVDVASVSGDEAALADAVEAALRGSTHLDVVRDGNVVVARTELGRAERVVLAGHLDTVPIAGNMPSPASTGSVLLRLGTSDMKGGVAVLLRLAHSSARAQLDPRVDVTWVYYDCEEIEAAAQRAGPARRASAPSCSPPTSPC